MRSVIFASLSLIFGAVTAFAAEDPPQPASTTAAPSQAAPAASPSTPAASPSPPAGSQPAPAPATSSTVAHATNSQELTPAEKSLIAQGYKLQVKDGQRTFCRREVALGSHFEKKVCGTAEQLADSTREAKDITERTQSRGTNPTGN